MKRSDITKQNILAAAEKAFSEKGLYGARVDEISALAGANKRMIYAYYGSKEKLYIAVLNTVYQRLAEGEKALLNRKLGCVETVRQIIKHSFAFLYENPSFVKMVMWENLHEAEYMKRSEAQIVKGAAMTLLREMLGQGMEQGIFRQDLDIEEMILSINMFCFSYFSNIYTMAQIMQADLFGRDEIEKRCEHVTDVILRYIIKEKE